MINTDILKRSSIFRNFVISYLLVFIIPLIIIFGSLYKKNIKILENEILNSDYTILNNYKVLLDEKLNRAKHICYSLDNNRYLNRWVRTEEEFTIADKLDALNFINDVSRSIAANSFIDGIYVYSRNSDFTISNSNTSTKLDRYEDIHKIRYEKVTLKEWHDIMNMKHNGTIISFPIINNVKNSTNSLYFIQSLPLISNSKTDATVVINFNLDFIKINNREKQLLLIKSNNDIIFSTNNKNSINYNYNDFTSPSGSFTSNKQLISYVKTTEMDGVFIITTPKKVFFKKINNQKYIAWFTLFLCIIVGGVMTFYFTSRNYNPIKTLLSLTKRYESAKNIDIDKDYNLTDIGTSLLDAIDELAKYENYYVEEEKKNKEITLLELISTNNTDIEKISNQLNLLNVKFTSKNLVMIMIRITDFDNNFLQPNPKEKNNNGNQYIKTYNNLLNELTANEKEKLIIDNKKTVLLIINHDNDIRNRLKYAQNFMRENYAVDSQISISKNYSSISYLPQMYKEVAEITEYFKLTGSVDIVSFNELITVTTIKSLEQTHISEINTLTTYLHEGEFNKALTTLDLIFNKYFFDEVNSPQIIRIRMFSLINNIITTLLTLEVPNIDKFIEELQPFVRILKCNNSIMLYNEIKKIIGETILFFEKEENNINLVLKNDIIKLVDNHYKNPNINVSFISNATGRSLDYISRYFKSMTNIGLLDYIHKKRITEAKKLLESDKTISQISKELGYSNSDSFIRVFKKFESVTPGQYKKKHCN